MHIELKWGTLKGWDDLGPAAQAAGQKLFDLAPRSMSAIAQHDTPEQKQALCELIDAVASEGGEIWNDWTDEQMTAEAAKTYVLEYDLERSQ